MGMSKIVFTVIISFLIPSYPVIRQCVRIHISTTPYSCTEVKMYKQMANFQKSPPKDMDGVYEENSDFRGKITNRQGGKHELYWLLFSQLSSDNFRKHTIQHPGSWPTTSYPCWSSPVHHTVTINPFLSLLPRLTKIRPVTSANFLPHNCFFFGAPSSLAQWQRALGQQRRGIL